MIIDCNLIAYQYDTHQATPNPLTYSGERDENKNVDKYAFSKNNGAVLVLEDDIINDEGYGLKKGFYNVVEDKYLDFLYIYQQGKIKAKVPVAHIEYFESANVETKQKPKKMSYSKFLKEQEKERQKYIMGLNPNNVDYKEAQIRYIDEDKSYLLIYNHNNIELTGIIKF